MIMGKFSQWAVGRGRGSQAGPPSPSQYPGEVRAQVFLLLEHAAEDSAEVGIPPMVARRATIHPRFSFLSSK